MSLIPGRERTPGGGNGILAWEIPWTEEPGEPLSMELQSGTGLSD